VVAPVVVQVLSLVMMFCNALVKATGEFRLNILFENGDSLSTRNNHPLVLFRLNEGSLDNDLPLEITSNLGLRVHDLPLTVLLVVKLYLVDIVP
jgi:hypothetical protein